MIMFKREGDECSSAEESDDDKDDNDDAAGDDYDDTGDDDDHDDYKIIRQMTLIGCSCANNYNH